MTRPRAFELRDTAGRFRPGRSGNPAGRRPDQLSLPILTIPVKEMIMAAASRRVPALEEDTELASVTLFEACVEVLGSARQGDQKSAKEHVRTVQLAAASVPPVEPFPEAPSQETIEAIMTNGSDEEFEALLASQNAFFVRLTAEYSDNELGTVFRRAVRKKSRLAPR